MEVHLVIVMSYIIKVWNEQLNNHAAACYLSCKIELLKDFDKNRSLKQTAIRINPEYQLYWYEVLKEMFL